MTKPKSYHEDFATFFEAPTREKLRKVVQKILES